VALDRGTDGPVTVYVIKDKQAGEARMVVRRWDLAGRVGMREVVIV